MYHADSNYLSKLKSETATIASSGTKTGAISTGNFAPVLIVTPSAMTGDSLSFEVSIDGSTFVPLYDEFNTLVSIPVATSASRAYSLGRLANLLSVAKFWKIVSDDTEAASRDIQVVYRCVD